MKIISLALILSLSCTSTIKAEVTTPLAGKIWSVAKGNFVSFNTVLQDIVDDTYILLGERHGRKAHQDREAFIIGALAEAKHYPTIAFEMLNHTQDSIVKEYQKSSPEYALGLAVPLKWSKSNWPSWSFYHPVFDAAFTTKALIVGADLTDAEQDIIKENAPQSIAITPTSLSYYKAQMTRAHCGLIEDGRVEKLAHLQIARDKQMAATLTKQQDSKFGALLVVGSAHVRKSSGIPNYLPADETTVITMLETDELTNAFINPFQDIVTGDLTDFDYIWFTSKIEKPSLCDRIGKSEN